jgi:hypothetical protein
VLCPCEAFDSATEDLLRAQLVRCRQGFANLVELELLRGGPEVDRQTREAIADIDAVLEATQPEGAP